MKKQTKYILSLLLSAASLVACNGRVSSSSNELSSTNSSQTSSSYVPRDYTGEGRPNDAFGNEGDTYTDSTTNEKYIKNNGHWQLVSNEGQQQLTGEGAPTNDLGNNGDTYTDTANGNVYVKQNGQWILIKEGEKEEEHTVTFDLNGGQMPDGSIEIPSQSVKNGGWVTKPLYDPIKQNCTFQGWYPNGEGTKWSFTSSVYGDLHLVAKYSVNEQDNVTLTIDPNNGDEPYTIETFIGDIPKIETPSKDGFNFMGWYYKDTNERFIGVVGEGDNGRTLVAKFEESKFNFKYQLENDNTITITGLLDIESVSVVVPSSIGGYTVASLGETAFQSRIYLVDVTLPSTIKNIHRQAFLGARMLTTINVDSSNPYFQTVDGILYTKDLKEIVYCPPKNRTSFTCPASLEKIGDYAFYGHKNSGVSSITFNEGLKEIGVKAFYENTGITTLRLPSTLKKIGNGAFNCVSAQGNIQKVDFNEGLEVIGDSAFVGAYFKDKFTLPSSVKEIGSYAFANCTAITDFEFPKSLETLGANAFAGATGILRISIAEGNTNFVVKNNLLYTSDMKKVVMCPSGHVDKVVIEEGVEEIGDYAFYMVDRAQEYELPSTLTKIGEQAFAHCYELKSFTIPDSVTSIGENCFDLCEGLRTINIGSGLKEIPEEAFIECFSLTDLVIPSTIETIGDEAFFGCTAINKLDLPEGLKKIGNAAFYFSTTEYNAYDKPAITTLDLPDSLTYLGDRSFAYQANLTTVNVGSGLEYFGSSAFEGAPISSLNVSSDNPNFSSENKMLLNKDKTELYFALTNLEGHVNIPSTVKVIEDFAFDGCKLVTSVTFPETLEEIGEGAFEITKITDIEFPSSLKKIGDGAFYIGSLKNIKFNEGLEEIGVSAFASNDIESLKLPNSLKKIGEGAFSTSWKLTSLELGSGLTHIGNFAFQNSRKISGEVVFPASLEYLGTGLFVNNTSITNFKMAGEGNFVAEDGMLMDKEKKTVYAFASGYSSTSVVVPDSVEEIKEYAFCNAEKLTNITLSSNLKTIGEKAFANVYKVTELIIPISVTYIGDFAFTHWGYSSVQNIKFECSQDFALMHFGPYFLGDIISNVVITYDYKG